MKKCPNCKSEFQGRSNKIYCSIECKTEVNNRRARERAAFAQNIEKSLRRSRYALLKLVGDNESAKATRAQLIREGYSFKHFTHQISLKDGTTGRVHYDFAVFPEGDHFKIQYLYG